jgi:lipoic acid synthetase
MILGSQCTRRCGFCAIDTGRPVAPDPAEPEHVAEAAAHLKLEHVVITSVARDDLSDQGAGHFAETIRAVRARLPRSGIEVLTPDFRADERCLMTVLDAHPDVFNHNLETVERLSPSVRPQARYRRTLEVLANARRLGKGIYVKSGMMLGLGETEAEVGIALRDLADAGCQLLTIGQYLRPTPAHLAVERYVEPAEFDRWAERAAGLGFLHVASSPFTRSSHHAAEALAAARSRENSGGTVISDRRNS